MSRKEVDDACELCDEVRWSGRAATGDVRGLDMEEGFSRLVLRTRVADVLSGLGCLAPGYALVVPHRHTWSVGELPRGERAHVFGAAWRTAQLIRRTFGKAVVLVEHGSSGARGGTGGSCVTHAHLHLFPVNAEADLESFVPPGSLRTTASGALAEAAGQRRNYYYCSWKPDEGHLLIDPKLPSQYARRVWAGQLHEPDLWDWAAFPFFGTAQQTAVALREAQAGQHLGPVDETLLAYDSDAASYARRTASFAPGSALPEEIDELADTGHGLVLDAGAGAGRDTLRFAQRGRSVVALDASMRLLSHAPAHARALPVLGDVRRLPLPPHCVSAVWCSAVLLHLPAGELVQALREFHRVLLPGGVAQISVKEGRGHVALPMNGYGSPRRHFYFYRAESLRSMAERSGFETVRTWTEDEMDSSSAVQRWIKVLLRKPA